MMSRISLLVACVFFASCHKKIVSVEEESISQAMDDIMTRLYDKVPSSRFDSLNEKFILNFIEPAEKRAFASQYQRFNVNAPAVVSLMRDQAQPTIPFWLAESGFTKTDMVVKNEEFVYEVWQRRFSAGRVELGINGFDKHRSVYFISVAPQDTSKDLVVTNVFPDYPLSILKKGAFTYHDWSGLVITEVPPALKGQILFTTVRGRAREAHIINAFRKTIFPSSTKPDQIMLTWSGSPLSTIDIQWRTSTEDADGIVQYWIDGKNDTLTTTASKMRLEDRMLYNERFVNRFTAHLDGLQPGSTYAYQVGSSRKKAWSAVKQFRTESRHERKFSFVWFGDTHCFPDSGRLINMAKQKSDAAFYSIAGDIVSTGLYRDDWDMLFGYAGDAFSTKPLMPVLGNHDRQDGLGAQLYYDLFSLPGNSPPHVEREASYMFEYGNALFLMIDATSDVADHSDWIEQALSTTKATWKFVMFHFPPYNFEEPYLDIQEQWVPLFDKYHVDMVMGGHIHYYMRSAPMFNGDVVPSYDRGTVYAISISIPNKHNSMTSEAYAVKQFDSGYFYQTVDIDGENLKYTAIDSKGVVRDEFVIEK